MMVLFVICCTGFGLADDYRPDRCEIIPLPDDVVSFRVDGEQKVAWHFGDRYPRPFFYPFYGPAGASLTRMGHPGAENHDHHRSIWFAHAKLNGTDFWSDNSQTQVRQKFWYRYRDGNEEAVMAVALGWYDQADRELMQQDLVAALRPMADGEYVLELQLNLRPGDGLDGVTLEQTNFGLLAVRVAKSISEYFGAGRLTNSEGLTGEPQIFGHRARWMDYSGPVTVGSGPVRKTVVEGITFFDHPTNPRYPTFWHVREDGWMGASFGMKEAWELTADHSLQLRYLLYSHSGAYDPVRSESVHQAFANRLPFRIRKASSDEKHRQFEVERSAE